MKHNARISVARVRRRPEPKPKSGYAFALPASNPSAQEDDWFGAPSDDWETIIISPEEFSDAEFVGIVDINGSSCNVWRVSGGHKETFVDEETDQNYEDTVAFIAQTRAYTGNAQQLPRPPPRHRKRPESARTFVSRTVREQAKPFDPERRYPRETKPHHFAVNPNWRDKYYKQHLTGGSVRAARDTYDAILEGAATAFFASAWADGVENAGGSLPGGTYVLDIMPPVPEQTYEFADKFLRAITDDGLMQSVVKLYFSAAAGSLRHERPPTTLLFGHYLAMQALGHGVSWEDDHELPKNWPELPDVEYIVDVPDPNEPERYDINYEGLSSR